MIAVVGLGNPGRRYAHTRHNVGFDVVDILARRRCVRVLSRQCRALVGKFCLGDHTVIFVKPQTFMNDSGLAVKLVAAKYDLATHQIIVVCDDIDLPLGVLRIRRSGSSGGHKGLQSVIEHLGSSEFPRVRIGIGRSGEPIDYVLSRFCREERQIIDGALKRAADAIEMIVTDGIETAMNFFNRQPRPSTLA